MGMRNIKMATNPSKWVDITDIVLIHHIERCRQFFPVFLLALWVRIVCMKAIPHFNMADKYYIRDINSLIGAFCANQYYASLFKCVIIFAKNKKFIKLFIFNLGGF